MSAYKENGYALSFRIGDRDPARVRDQVLTLARAFLQSRRKAPPTLRAATGVPAYLKPRCPCTSTVLSPNWLALLPHLHLHERVD